MKRVQNTHKPDYFDDLHDTLLAIVGAFNRPQRDEIMIKKYKSIDTMGANKK